MIEKRKMTHSKTGQDKAAPKEPQQVETLTSQRGSRGREYLDGMDTGRSR
jgi:Zn/Cd-binding protein ZinT